MLVLEIAPNANCDAVEMRVFHDLEPPRPVTHVHLEHEPGHPQWYALTGWTQIGRCASAIARRVDDSGEGVVYLVSGGDAGLRLQPERRQATWQLTDTQQFGAPFLLIADPKDLRFLPVPPTPS